MRNVRERVIRKENIARSFQRIIIKEKNTRWRRLGKAYKEYGIKDANWKNTLEKERKRGVEKT